MVDEKKHARFNCSASERWSNCPGSVALVESLPFKPEPGPAALEGTRLHDLCEKAIKTFLNFKITGEGPSTFELEDESDLEIVSGYVQAICKEVLHESVTGKAWATEDLLIIDEALDIWGTGDYWSIHIDDRGKRCGSIVDFKSGYTNVDIEKNSQMMCYCLGLLKEIRKGGKDLDYFITYVYQPKVQRTMKIAKYTAKQIEKFEQKLLKAVTQVASPKPKFKCGSYCGFCPAQGVCPEYAKHNQTLTQLALLDAQTLELPTPEKLTDEQLCKIGLNADLISDFVMAVKKYCIDRAIKAVPVTGTKVIKKEGRRGWIEDKKAVEDLIKALGKDPYEPKLIGIGKAEKLCGKGKLDSVIEKGSGGFELTNDADIRAGIDSALKALEG